MSDENARVARQLRLLSPQQQHSLFQSHIAVVGVGGLGCPLLLQLAAAGVGEITVYDHDTVSLSNLHRQILFGVEDVGRAKVDVAAERLKKIQPGIAIHAYKVRLDEDTALQACSSADMIVDGSDNFATKYLVADAAEVTNTPLVWGTVLRFHGDLAVFHSGSENRGVGLRDVFPHQLPPDAVEDCATAGVLGATTSVVGSLMATAVIGWITEIDRSVGVITSYDAFGPALRSVRAVADPQRVPVTCLARDYFPPAVDPKDFDLVLDVREDGERSIEPVDAVPLPLNSISSQDDVSAVLPEHSRILVICAAGKRSAEFVSRYAHLAANKESTLTSLTGGISQLRRSN